MLTPSTPNLEVTCGVSLLPCSIWLEPGTWLQPNCKGVWDMLGGTGMPGECYGLRCDLGCSLWLQIKGLQAWRQGRRLFQLSGDKALPAPNSLQTAVS